MSSLAKQVQEYVVETLKKSSTLKRQAIVAQDSKSLLFEMKNALGKQGLILVVSTPESNWTGYLTTESQAYSGAWDVDFSVTAIENPIVNRSKQDLTGQDAALAAADYLSKQFGKFLVKSYTQYQDGQLVANEIKAACLALEGAVESKIYSAKSYISKGLVAMWDGIENAGFGQHSGSSRVWKDLASGDFSLNLQSAAYFSDDAINFNYNDRGMALATSAQTSALIDALVAPGYSPTVEIVVTDPHKANVRYFQGPYELPLFGYVYQFNLFGMAWNPSKAPSKSGLSCPRLRNIQTTQSFSVNYTRELYDLSHGYTAFAKSPIWANGQSKDLNAQFVWASVGQNFSIGNAAYTQPFSVHSIRIYNRPLSEDEILHNYEVDSKRFDLTDMSAIAQTLEQSDPEQPVQVNTFQEEDKEEVLTI